MPRRTSDRKVERGIRRHGSGLQAYVRVNGELRTQQYDRDHPREDIRQWLRRQELQRSRIRRGTLAADAKIYLSTIADRRKRVNDAGRLAHWLRSPLAHLPRGVITSAQIKAQMATWLTEPQPRKERRPGHPVPPQPLSVETVNKCLTVLRSLYRELNQHDDDPNAAARVSKLHVEQRPPTALADYALVEAILAEMPDRGEAHRGKGNRSTVNKAKLRCALMAFTGWPPAQIMRIDPADIVWGPPVLVRLRPRRKGKGTAERWMPVTEKGEIALRAWVAGEAQGAFSASSMRRTWQRACRALRKRQEAEGITPLVSLTTSPYVLRHTFITHTLRQSSSLAGTQYLAMHSDPRQTLHYAQAAIPDEAQKAATGATAAQRSLDRPKEIKA